MAFNGTIESPNFEKITKEAGQFTSDAVSLLWNALNDTRRTERIDFRLTRDMIAPKVIQVNAGASVDNLDLQDASVVEFIGTTAQNFTGMKAPETGRTRIVVVYTSGSGTITHKHEVTSEAANRLTLAGGADSAQATRGCVIYAYLSGGWREIA